MERFYRRIFKHPDLEIPVPTRQSVVGFIVVVIIAAMMILSLYGFAWWMKS